MSKYDFAPDTSNDNGSDNQKKAKPPLLFSADAPPPPVVPPPIPFEALSPILKLADKRDESAEKKKKSKRRAQPIKDTKPKSAKALTPEHTPHVLKLMDNSTSGNARLEKTEALTDELSFQSEERNDITPAVYSEESSKKGALDLESKSSEHAGRQKSSLFTKNISPAMAEETAGDVDGTPPLREAQSNLPPPPMPPQRSEENSKANVNLPSIEEEAVARSPVREVSKKGRYGGGILPAPIVDLLSRRGERKLRQEYAKDVRKLEKEIKDTEQRLKISQKYFENNVSGKQKLDKLAPANESYKTKAYKEHNRDSSIPPIIALEKELAERRRELTEKQKEAELRQNQALERMLVWQKNKLQKKEGQKESLFAKSETAGEDLEIDEDAIPEKAFDRRHEVLDQQGKSLQPQFVARGGIVGDSSETGPVPISQILSERSVLSSFGAGDTSTAKIPMSSADNSNDLYMRSLRIGFYGGAVCTVLGLLAYFVF